MTPIIVVAGFVGSGKTTLLRRLHENAGGRRIVFLVNEWSGAEVDAHTLRADGAQVIELPGGSLVCRCLAPAFLDQLLRMAEESARMPLDGVVIEASGLADPKPLPALLHEARLDRFYTLQTVVTVVDPRRVVRLAQTLPVLAAQVKTADHVVLNKCDLCDAATLDQAEQWVRSHHSKAQVHRCVYAALPFDVWWKGTKAHAEGGAIPVRRDESFEIVPLSVAEDIVPERLAEAFQWLPDGWLRVKGFVVREGRTWRVDWDGMTAMVQPVRGSPPPAPQLVAVVQRSVVNQASERWTEVLRRASTLETGG